MRRVLLLSLLLACSFLATDRAEARKGGSGGGSFSGTFQAVGGSGVGGTVTLRAISSGTSIAVRLTGLQPDVEYVATWSTTVACDVGTTPSVGAFYRFRGSKRGTAGFTADVSEPLDQIHSVAIQLGNGLSLVACAPVN